MQLSNLSIGTRLKGGFAIVLTLAAALALVAWLQIQKIGAIVSDINDSWMVSVIQLGEMRSALSDLRRSELRYVLSNEPAHWDAQDQARAAALQRFDAAVKPYEATGISGPEEQKLYDASHALRGINQATWPKLRELARGGEPTHAQAVAYLLGESKTTFDAADKALSADMAFNVAGSAAARDRSVEALRLGGGAIVAALATVLALGAAFAWWLSRSIVRPLQQAIGSARVMASGDLSHAVDVSGKDESGQLLAALADMQTRLRSTIGGIQASADQVGTASAQIASGNADLSARTEQQASNLQQTAASVEELSATVAQGAQSASQANQLAASAADAASRGGQVVGEVVGTMGNISASSKRIADIIGVIDGIAFQTNILALNAAVEAARAGEQGRGFAVVANEVRTLATRSADAAKEIKNLIQASVEQVDAGSQQVQHAGATMGEIVAAVRKVSDLIGEVSAAAIEQNAGFRQVNGAVTALDQATQQNAALVEESAAAAESLREQAQRLTQAVGQFRLGTV